MILDQYSPERPQNPVASNLLQSYNLILEDKMTFESDDEDEDDELMLVKRKFEWDDGNLAHKQRIRTS